MMDPNEVLERLRKKMREQRLIQEHYPITGGPSEFMVLFELLDKWLSEGKYLPYAWERKGKNAKAKDLSR